MSQYRVERTLDKFERNELASISHLSKVAWAPAGIFARRTKSNSSLSSTFLLSLSYPSMSPLASPLFVSLSSPLTLSHPSSSLHSALSKPI